MSDNTTSELEPTSAPDTTVPSTSQSDDSPPHGIRGTASNEPNYELLGLAALSIFLVIVTAYLIFVRFKKKAKKQAAPPPIDPLLALINEVKQSFPQEVFGPKEQEDYFYRLSVCLRLLIEKVTKIPASEATIRELRPLLNEKLPVDPSVRQSVIQFLDRADQIKYAGIRSDRGEAEAARENVLQWMLMLTRSP